MNKHFVLIMIIYVTYLKDSLLMVKQIDFLFNTYFLYKNNRPLMPLILTYLYFQPRQGWGGVFNLDRSYPQGVLVLQGAFFPFINLPNREYVFKNIWNDYVRELSLILLNSLFLLFRVQIFISPIIKVLAFSLKSKMNSLPFYSTLHVTKYKSLLCQ